MSKSETLYSAARELIPGGVNSPVRAFSGVGGTPLFIERADGARLYDVDGKAYIDYVGSWGPLILGHAHPEVVKAVQDAAVDGLSFGAPTEREVEMAELLCGMLPSLDMVRLVSSGTEATMSAIRLARGFTGRDLLIKFEGLLPRPFRRSAGQGRLRPPDLRQPEFRRRAGRRGTAHAGA